MKPSVLEFANRARELEPELVEIWQEFLGVCDELSNLGLTLKRAEHTIGSVYQPEFNILDGSKWISALFDEYYGYYYKTHRDKNLVPLQEGLFQPSVNNTSRVKVPANDPDVLRYKEAARAFTNKAKVFDDKAEKLSEMACALFNETLRSLLYLFDLRVAPCRTPMAKLFANYNDCKLIIYIEPPYIKYEYTNELFGLEENRRILIAGPIEVKNSTYYDLVCKIVADEVLVEEILKNPEDFKDLIEGLK